MEAGFFVSDNKKNMRKIAIQGTLGSYHDIAAHKYFEGEEIQTNLLRHFRRCFAAVKRQ